MIDNQQVQVIINAVNTESILGTSIGSGGPRQTLASIAGAPALIRVEITGKQRADSSEWGNLITHFSHILVGRGDDPWLLFVNCMTDRTSQYVWMVQQLGLPLELKVLPETV